MVWTSSFLEITETDMEFYKKHPLTNLDIWDWNMELILFTAYSAFFYTF